MYSISSIEYFEASIGGKLATIAMVDVDSESG